MEMIDVMDFMEVIFNIIGIIIILKIVLFFAKKLPKLFLELFSKDTKYDFF